MPAGGDLEASFSLAVRRGFDARSGLVTPCPHPSSRTACRQATRTENEQTPLGQLSRRQRAKIARTACYAAVGRSHSACTKMRGTSPVVVDRLRFAWVNVRAAASPDW